VVTKAGAGQLSGNLFGDAFALVPSIYSIRIAIIALNGFFRTPRINQKTETV
jgi:hypothetical protein